MKTINPTFGLHNSATPTDFATFYNAYFQRFVRYAYHYVGDQSTAEDMTHDALLYYWENRHKLSKEVDLLGYILITVKNRCLNYLKHLKVEQQYATHANLQTWEIDLRIGTLEDESYSAIFSKDIMQIVKDSLSALPQQTQEIFLLNRFESKTRKEIAQLLGVSQQKVDYHVNKATDHLYTKLKDYMPVILLLFSSLDN